MTKAIKSWGFIALFSWYILRIKQKGARYISLKENFHLKCTTKLFTNEKNKINAPIDWSALSSSNTLSLLRCRQRLSGLSGLQVIKQELFPWKLWIYFSKAAEFWFNFGFWNPDCFEPNMRKGRAFTDRYCLYSFHIYFLLDGAKHLYIVRKNIC